MKDIVSFLNEAKEFNPEDVIAIYNDNTPLLNYIANITEKDRKDFSISMDGIKYKRMLVPNTKLSQKLTGVEILDLVIKYLEDKNELDKKISKNIKYKKLSKDKELSWIKGTKGGATNKEKLDARRNAENARIVKGQPREEDIYKN